MAKQQEAIRERVHTNIREPRKYKVLIHNDDFTTMDFVVMILKVVFFKTDTEAETLMLAVHRSSQAVVGVYGSSCGLPFTFNLSTWITSCRFISIHTIPTKCSMAH